MPLNPNLEAIDMGTKTFSQEFKSKILEEVKKLTNEGKHQEASALFNAYFDLPETEQQE
tara:strand:+ start:444 stop:620 length:177 start_codon:yes stop_codon:yes gene_type:complete